MSQGTRETVYLIGVIATIIAAIAAVWGLWGDPEGADGSAKPSPKEIAEIIWEIQNREAERSAEMIEDEDTQIAELTRAIEGMRATEIASRRRKAEAE